MAIPLSHRDAEWSQRPIPVHAYAAARAEGPVLDVAPHCWFVSQHGAVVEALQTVRDLRADLSMDGNKIPCEELFLSEIPVPRHGKIRRLYNAEFGPHRIGRFAAFVDELCTGLVENLVARGEGDLVKDYIRPIPSSVIAHVIGVPAADAQRFIAWSEEGVMQTRRVDLTARGIEAALPLHSYIEELIDMRRQEDNQAHDVITRFINARIDGEPLTSDEIRTQVQFVVGSAVETTRKLLTNIFTILLANPDMYQRLRSEPALAVPMVEETMRFLSPVQSTVRKCIRNTEIAGVAIAEGDVVVVGLASANRDETAFGEPGTFDVDRRDVKGHVGFGAGPHICPGAHLARLEATAALRIFCCQVAYFTAHPTQEVNEIPIVNLRQPESMLVEIVRG